MRNWPGGASGPRRIRVHRPPRGVQLRLGRWPGSSCPAWAPRARSTWAPRWRAARRCSTSGPWCRPCREEIPVLAAYAARPGALPVVGINVQDQPADALDALTALGAHYPSVTDPDAALLAALRSPPVLPVTYVLRPDGSVAWVDPPVVFRTPDEVAAAVARSAEPAR
ncbi:TlpA family protein disulfide reductase [Pseudonocardia oceani]|uniref:TlpA family protein disulfide reductase n=1 Tax=Pseudonocardia oceani TaxID=2792013 RepID=UPI001CEC5EEF